MNVKGLARKAERANTEYRLAVRKWKEENKELKRLEREEEQILQAQKVVQLVAQAVQTKAHRQVAGVVTGALRAVFKDDSCEFRIVFDKKRGRTDARPVFVQGGQEVNPRHDSGGMLDVAAFALRLTCVVLHRPKLRPVLVLDEPFKHLSRDYAPRMRNVLLSLARKMKVQIVMVTHQKKLACGKVVHF